MVNISNYVSNGFKPWIKYKDHTFFYTKRHIVRDCITVLRKYCTWQDFFLDPGAGAGIWLSEIGGNNKEGWDTHPKSNKVEKKNFHLVNRHNCYDKYLNNAVVVGTPPFGKRNAKSNRFIKESLTFAKIIAFVLPHVYNKYSMQRIFPDNWILVENIKLPKNAFIDRHGKDYDVPSVFQVWINLDRKKTNALNIREIMYKTEDIRDISRRLKDGREWFLFGAKPERIIKASETTDKNRGYFFNASEEVVEIMRNLPWKDYAYGRAKMGVAWYDTQLILKIYSENKEDNPA